MWGCVAISATWSNQALALTWQDPHESVQCMPAPEPKNAAKASGSRGVKSSELGPWDVIVDTTQGQHSEAGITAEAAESVSTVVESDFGPWSSASSHVRPSAPVAATPTTSLSTSASDSLFGPWGAIAPARSSTSSLGLWGSIAGLSDGMDRMKSAKPCVPTFGPQGASSASSEEECDTEAVPGQIGSPK
jgi:hypothetical protein